MDLAGIRALVVDDEADTRELVAQIIEHQGGVAQKAESYDAALAAINQFTPNILLIDIGMPSKNGYALIAALRAKGALNRTPAIAVTAYATDADRNTALDAGFQAHITKPFDPEALVGQILDLVYQTPSEPKPA
jgi:CheY-like chemotaxis protein